MKKECANCGAIRELADKPEPATVKEGRQVLFNCRACGAVNYRDGTAVIHGQRSGKHGQLEEPIEEPEREPGELQPERSSSGGRLLTVLAALAAAAGVLFVISKNKAKSKESSSGSPQDPLNPWGPIGSR